MARTNKTRFTPKEGIIHLEKKSDNITIVEYEPHADLIYFAKKDNIDSRVKILEINTDTDLVTIYPINSYPSNNGVFLGQKYDNIKKIVLNLQRYHRFNQSQSGVREILENLPAGFVKDYDYGLGLQKDYRFIIQSVSKIPNIDTLKILRNEDTRIDNSSYILRISEFDTIRKSLNRVTSKHQKNSQAEKNVLSHNFILTKVDPNSYPEVSKPYKKDTIFKVLGEYELNKNNITKNDSKYLLELLGNNKNALKNQHKELIKLKNGIDLVNLETLIKNFEKKITQSCSESIWQKLLNNNPFILSLVFNYPIIKIGEQVSIGGRTYSGKGEKITDFLVKNEISNNSALVEIKKPSSKIINTKEYRGGVYPPSSELSSSITQILDQRYLFAQQIMSLNSQSDETLESFSINCILIIGLMPKEKPRVKSLELFRNNSKSVVIITFDELLKKLKALHAFLK